MRVNAWVPVAMLVGALSVATGVLSAQVGKRELVGIVRDPNGAALEGAIVAIRGASVRTNARGAFQLWTTDIDTVTITIKRVGFLEIEAQLTARNKQWDTVMVQMDRGVQNLAEVNVKENRTRGALGLRDFDARRAKGNGVFVAREEIAARNSSRVSDVLRNKRGVRLISLRSGRYGVRFAQYGAKGESCAPDVWLDGSLARGMEVDDILASDVEAMELYESFAALPFEFTPSGSKVPCGTIVIWTRIPNGKKP